MQKCNAIDEKDTIQQYPRLPTDEKGPYLATLTYCHEQILKLSFQKGPLYHQLNIRICNCLVGPVF